VLLVWNEARYLVYELGFVVLFWEEDLVPGFGVRLCASSLKMWLSALFVSEALLSCSGNVT